MKLKFNSKSILVVTGKFHRMFSWVDKKKLFKLYSSDSLYFILPKIEV